MKAYIKKMKSDFRGYFFRNCRWRIYSVNRAYYKCIMFVLIFLKDIKIGRKFRFYGKTYFYRYPESEISIGYRCTFDSAQFQNLVGITKCCTISTQTQQAKLKIGNFTGFSGVRIGCFESITIGDKCLFGANVTITDSDWHALDPKRRHDDCSGKTKPVIIGNNVLVGLNSIILKGTEIGDNSVIGAGSVVSGSIPPNVIAAGNPCKVIKHL